MTILMIDGFDMYDGNYSVPTQRGWSMVPNGCNQPGRFANSKAIYLYGQTNFMGWQLPAATSTLSMGVAVSPSSLPLFPTTGSDVLRFCTGTTLQCKLGFLANGAIAIGRADYSTNVIATSAAGLVGANPAWCYIEVEIVRSATVGTFNVYLNGVQVISVTGANTGAANFDNITLGGNPIQNTFFDDFYLTNTATRLGEQRVETLVPSADAGTEAWTPSTGTAHWSLLDEIPCNGDTDYISSATAGQKDQFSLTDLSTTPASISAVQTYMVARKDDATLRQLRTDFLNGSTTSVGTTRTMGSTYNTWSDLYALDPDTSAAWTATLVNAAQLGVEVVT